MSYLKLGWMTSTYHAFLQGSFHFPTGIQDVTAKEEYKPRG